MLGPSSGNVVSGEVLEVLRSRFDAGVRELVTIYEEPHKAMYRAERGLGVSWVVRVFSVTRPLERVLGDAAVLRYVASLGVSAERVVAASDGADSVTVGGRGVLVTEWIEGIKPGRTPATLRRVGEAVGRLHALPPPPEDDPLLQRRAGALPASDLAFGRSCLERVARRVPGDYVAEYEALRDALHATSDCESVPADAWGLIHNDCHLTNVLETPTGEIAFFDWDGSGYGPRVTALGLLLYSCAVQAPHEDPGASLPFDLDRVDHVLEGYVRHHTLTEPEISLLPDAMRFRPAVVAARELAASIERGAPPGIERRPHSWATRYAEADAVAARAQAVLRGGPGR